MNTWQKGELARIEVIKRAIEKGCVPSTPVFEQCRYDLIIEENGKLERVQVKYSEQKTKSSSGSYFVDFRRNNNGSTLKRRYSALEIDAIMVYIKPMGVICKLGPKDFDGKSSVTLRAEPPRNNQRSLIRKISDFAW